jgi:hypothetical protein
MEAKLKPIESVQIRKAGGDLPGYFTDWTGKDRLLTAITPEIPISTLLQQLNHLEQVLDVLRQAKNEIEPARKKILEALDKATKQETN